MVSLIVCTLGRVHELERLLASLEIQTYKNFEVLLVDQNEDDRIDQILEAHPTVEIRHLRSGRGLSRGRNLALPLAKGDILCFPDDDCWYPQDLLASVVRWFHDHPEFAGLFVCLRDDANHRVGSRWPKAACLCTKENLWDRGSPSAFLRRSVADSVGLFNESLGMGSDSLYQAGEETDYFLRGFRRGCKMWFEPAFTVHHLNLHGVERLRQTTYPYALGCGYIFRTHHYRVSFVAWMVARSLGGAAVRLCKADIENTRIYLLRAAGQIRGYVWGPRDLARLNSRVG